MSLNTDTSFFHVLCDIKGTIYTPEMDVEDLRFSQIVADIQSGQLDNVKAVFEFNPAEGWCNDVTADVMAATFPELEDGGEDYSDYAAERVSGAVAGVEHRVAA